MTTLIKRVAQRVTYLEQGEGVPVINNSVHQFKFTRGSYND